MSYTDYELLTFHKRAQCAQITQRRLTRWFRAKEIALQHKLQLWKATVLPTILYGLIATNITPQTLHLFQKLVFGMYRRVCQDFSHRTHHSHADILAIHHLEHPLCLLQRHAEQLQHRLADRLGRVESTDVLHSIDWTHVHTQLHMIFEMMHIRPQADMNPAADEATPELKYQCNLCISNLFITEPSETSNKCPQPYTISDRFWRHHVMLIQRVATMCSLFQVVPILAQFSITLGQTMLPGRKSHPCHRCGCTPAGRRSGTTHTGCSGCD